MAKLIIPCQYCRKPLELVSSAKFSATESIDSYACGHSYIRVGEPVVDVVLQNVNRNKKARPYQEEGVDFIVNGSGENDGGFNCIIADQMRLGKTPQALLALSTAFAQGKKKKALILVKGANLWQWMKEYKDWCDSLPLGIFPIVGSKSYIPEGFNTYIMSMDTFSRDGSCKLCKHAMQRHDDITGQCSSKGCSCRQAVSNGDAMTDRLLQFGFDIVIVDEAHSFKNTSSRRSQSLIAFLKEINKAETVHTIDFTCPLCKHKWEEKVSIDVSVEKAERTVSKTSACEKCGAAVRVSAAVHVKVKRNCSVVMLTGTPVLNRADEYFIPLNIVAPQRFPSLDHFRKRWLMQDSKGKWSRVAPYVMEEFKRVTAPYVLRRTKEDVYQDCPKLNTMFTVIEVEDEKLKKAYNQVLDLLEDSLAHNPNLTYFQSIGELMILRRICGLAKVPFACDYVEEFLADSPDAKIAIGLHHESVKDALEYPLKRHGIMRFDGKDSIESKGWKQTAFEKSPEHVLLINMLAGGVGCDFHYVNDVLVLERQWNAQLEEQFNYRFYNPDRSIKNVPTDVECLIAKGTIDEWFHDHVEETRRVFGETVDSDYNLNDQSTFKSLLEKTVSHRL